LQSDDSSDETPIPPSDVAENTTPTLIQPTNPPATAVPTVTSLPQQVAVQLPPTAAADELGAWLLTPVDNAAGSGISGITRQDDAFTITGTTGRLEVEPYTVVSGDTLSGIADRFGLDVCTLVWSNPRNSVSPLRPGKTIDILPVDGVFFKVERPVTIQQVAEQTSVSPYAIIDSNFNDLFGTSPDSLLVEGMKIVVPDGDGGDCNIWAPAPGAVGSGVAGGGGGSLWGCSYGVDNPGFPGATPVSGNYTFFQGFSAAHTGVDLSASPGTPVLASGSGTVAFAGWNEYGYGNAIVIDHGGTYTLYGHLSAINVSCGQSVGAGETIGGVGSTGRSSGPHLHFEIRDSGFNPLDPVYSIRL
jgi:murein DD-endopeptidase MepM/ murein hydrolase activator NlpD